MIGNRIRTNVGGTASGKGGTIGPVEDSYFPGNDYGIVRVSSSAAHSTPLIRKGLLGFVIVAGSTRAVVGADVCRSGWRTCWHCGEIKAFNATVSTRAPATCTA